jgi:tRNA (guanine-N7-)-methyltransferase
MAQDTKRLRTIRSFVRREGRITPAQKRALKELWPRYGVPEGDEPLDLPALFGRMAPVMMEIGFGNGDALVAMAAANRDNNYLGIEVHRPGIGSLLLKLTDAGLDNVRVVQADAKELLAQRIPDAALSAVYLFFPDPWQKKRHHKRRLVQPDFVAIVGHRLRPGGRLQMATDWRDYAEHMQAVMAQAEGFKNRSESGRYAARPENRPLTRFEQRGRRLGHEVWDLDFERLA